MKPYFNIPEEDQNKILELKKKCEEINIGNVSYDLYGAAHGADVHFYITEYNTYWELVVKHQQARPFGTRKIYFIVTDIYKIKENKLVYEKSEEDLE